MAQLRPNAAINNGLFPAKEEEDSFAASAPFCERAKFVLGLLFFLEGRRRM